MRIDAVDAWEVLDSRGNPTVRVRVITDRSSGRFTVPAGASTGTHEALERRDAGDRYRGMGVRDAVEAVRTELVPVVKGRDPTDQRGIDAALVEADGTDDLSRFGANAVLVVSGAVAHAAANSLDIPLFEHLAPEDPGRLPLPMVNVLSGGRHAEGGLEVQDFMVIPVGATTYSGAIETVHAVRSAVRDRIESAGHRPLVGDEGGFSPPMDDPSAGLDLLVKGIETAGLDPGGDVAIAVDLAATQFYDGGRYSFSHRGDLTATDVVDHLAAWVAEYPIVSVEDPLAEDDWNGWRLLTDRLSDVQLLGDDLFATDRHRLDRGIQSGVANAVIVKPNQAGTLTRAIDVAMRAMDAGWPPVISARSGETCDTTIADLAVALDAGQIKIGSLARSERLAKYNRLFAIERTNAGEFADRSVLAPHH